MAVVALAAALLPAGRPAQAQSADEIARRIAELEEELNGVRQGIAEVEVSVLANMEVLAETEVEMAIAQERLNEAYVELDTSRTRLGLAEVDVVAAERRLASVESRVSLLETQLASVRSQMVETRRSVESRAVDLYMDFFSAGRWAVFERENLVDLTLGRVYGGDLLAQADEELKNLEALDQDRVAKESLLAEEKTALEEQLVVLDSRRQERVDELQEVERYRLEASEQLAVVEDLVTEVQVQIRGFREEQQGLEDDAERLANEIAYRKVLLARAQRPGRLGWPTNGLVSSPFGWRIHPILNRRIFHNGVDLDSPSGTPVRAAGDGRVILAQTWGGYGRAVVIQHGGDVTSIYAHLSRYGTSVGRDVDEGDVIGYVGCSGLCTGPHLHFEVRESGSPVNPMKYLQG